MGGRYGNVVTGPKKTPANTVKNSTFSTSNRFSGPQSGRTAVSTGGFGQGVGTAPAPSPAPADDALAAWLNSAGAQNLFAQNAQASEPSAPPSGRTAVSTGGFGQGVGQVSRPALAAAAVANQGPLSGRTAVSTGGFGQGVGQTQRPSVPAGPPSGRTAVSTGGFGEGYGQVSQPSGPPSGRDAMSTGGFGEGYGGGDPYAGLDLTSRANSNARMVLPSADEQRAAIAAGGTAYNPGQTARIDQIQDNRVMEWLGTEGAQNLLASNATAAAPAAPAPVAAWDPANNDAPITGAVGMWTDPTNGGQMPDPADADAWQAMQDAVDSEFGPDQSIYNPTYDTERFSTYDPSAPPAWGGGYGNMGGGAGAGLGTFDPFTGEYLQFGSELSGIESQRGMIDEADAFWDLAHQRKWDETNRGIPGIFNSRGMLDSGLLPRAQALSLSDQNYEQSVQDWQVANQKAALDAQQAAAEQGLTAARSSRVFDPWSSGYGVGR